MINKKGQLELSIGTIVVLVIGVSMLILGIILVRSIMCSGMQITQDLSSGVRNEVKNLFGGGQYGIKCVGTGGADVKLATGGRRAVVCIIKEDQPSIYNIVLDKTDVTSLTPTVSSAIVQSWILGTPGAPKVSVKAGGDGQDVAVLLLNIPRDAPAATIQIKMTSTKEGSSPESITSVVDVTPTGFIAGAIC
jgi:hypothetical protein